MHSRLLFTDLAHQPEEHAQLATVPTDGTAPLSYTHRYEANSHCVMRVVEVEDRVSLGILILLASQLFVERREHCDEESGP